MTDPVQTEAEATRYFLDLEALREWLEQQRWDASKSRHVTGIEMLESVVLAEQPRLPPRPLPARLPRRAAARPPRARPGALPNRRSRALPAAARPSPRRRTRRATAGRHDRG